MTDDSSTRTSQRKHDLLLDLLSQGSVLVYVDSTRSGVALPSSLMDQPQVHLHLSYAFANEVFVVDDLGVRVSLATRSLKMVCLLTWESIYYMQRLDEEGERVETGEVFLESVPHTLLDRYGLTMRVVDRNAPRRGDQPQLLWSPTTSTSRELDELAPKHDQKVISETSDTDRIDPSFNAWVHSLEKLDQHVTRQGDERDKRDEERIQELSAQREIEAEIEAELEAASEDPTITLTPREEPTFSKLLDLLSTVEDVMSNASRKIWRRGNLLSDQDLREGEHNPEQGLISLMRATKSSAPRDQDS